MEMTEVFKMAEDDMYRQKLSESDSMRNSTINIIVKTLNAKTLIAVLTSLLSPNPVVSNILCVYACFSKERSEPYQVVRNRQGEQIMRHST